MLQIEPAREALMVSCKLVTLEFVEHIDNAFALSYVWGDSKVTRDILVNGVRLAVTENLESALREIRRVTVPGYGRAESNVNIASPFYWIDAICINQNDTAERSHQVSLMQMIYSRAHTVFSWLGPPDDQRIDIALQTLRQIVLMIQSTEDGDGHKEKYQDDRVEDELDDHSDDSDDGIDDLGNDPNGDTKAVDFKWLVKIPGLCQPDSLDPNYGTGNLA